MKYLKFLPLISLFFISAHIKAQTWSLVGDNGNGVQIYANPASVQQGFGYVVTFDLKEHIRDNVVAGVPVYIDRYISYRCYNDTVSFKPVNIHDTNPTGYWTESASSDFLGLDFPTLLANILALRATPVNHP